MVLSRWVCGCNDLNQRLSVIIWAVSVFPDVGVCTAPGSTHAHTSSGWFQEAELLCCAHFTFGYMRQHCPPMASPIP